MTNDNFNYELEWNLFSEIEDYQREEDDTDFVLLRNQRLDDNAVQYNKLLELIPLLATFLTPLIIIPRTITKYLFNNKNEEDMIDILKTIIKHDEHTLLGMDPDDERN